jgi:hypothetical protein
MIGRRELGQWSLAVVAASAMLGLSGCGDDRWTDYTYKMTVHAGGKAFSTVRHVTVEEGSSIQDSSGRRVDRRTQGEAVIIDENGRTYYALMVPADGQFGNGFYAAYVAEAALVPMIGKAAESDVDKAIREYAEEQPGFDQLADDAATHNAMLRVVGPHSLPRSIAGAPDGNGPTSMTVWPMFVTFDDPKDPKTVRAVSPEEIGVSKITIEITDEPVTTGIEGRLGWRTGFGSKRLNGNRFGNSQSNNLAEKLSAYSFSTEPAE